MPVTLEELAFDLSRAAIEQQERRQAELRSRAATVLAAASIAASVLAAQVSARGRDDHVALTILAIGAYLGCVIATIYALLPHRLTLELRGSVALDLGSEADVEVDDALRVATRWLEALHDQNLEPLRRIGRAYGLGCALLGAEILLSTASYGTNLV